MTKQVEILSPAGSYESLKAAIAAGADAVYIGGTKFGARAYADNLSEELMLEAIDYAHLHGRKIYLTVNTLLKEQELNNQLYEYLLPYYMQGIDAVIVQDIGVLNYIKKQFPDLPIHASTQMTVTNLLGVQFLEELGVERVVTARELQLDEIKEITSNTNVEIESFVHGALCYCYSGQCLYSSMLGGRSGNRGQCAQPCRLPYKVKGKKNVEYVLSLKDICTLECIPELVEAGIYSFKIEGRMKKPEYVALVTAMYRKYVDLYLEKGKESFYVEPKDREMLMDLYNRGGSHTGYYHTKNGKEMTSLTRPNHAGVPALKVLEHNGKNVCVSAITDIHKGDVVELPDGKENFTFSKDVKRGQKVSFVTHSRQSFQKNHILNRVRNEQLLSMVQEEIISKKVKEKINGELHLLTNCEAVFRLSYGDVLVEVMGDTVQEALNQPMEITRIEKQMRKTGNTPFEFQNLNISIQGNVFLPLQSINELRRNGLACLEEKILSAYRRGHVKKLLNNRKNSQTDSTPKMHVYVENVVQLRVAMESKSVRRIYVDCNAFDAIWKNGDIREYIDSAHDAEKEIYLCMPHIFRKKTIGIFLANYEHILGANWDGVLIRNYESFQFLHNQQYKGAIVTDYNLYQFNQMAKEFWEKEGVESATAALELNYKELLDVGLENSELVVYGYYPMMISAQCVRKTSGECDGEKSYLALIDRYQKEFVVKNNCDYCYNIIYNTSPLILTDQKEEILSLNPKALRLHFTIESEADMRKILSMYEQIFVEGKESCEPETEFTRGHFKRGIK